MSIKDDENKGESRWDKTFRLLTRGLTPMQASVYKIIYEMTCDMEYTFLSTIPYDETVLRAIFVTHPSGKIFDEELPAKRGKVEYNTTLDYLLEKDGTEVKDTIDELCAKGFVSCKTIRFGDGVLEKMTGPTKVLIMCDIHRRILMRDIDWEFLRQAMTDEDFWESLDKPNQTV
jgi:hypothetical protein